MTVSYLNNDQKESEDWSTHYRALLESKLEEAGIDGALSARGRLPSSLGGEKGGLKKATTTSKGWKSSTSALAKSQAEVRNLKDMLAKTTKRALVAEERASEAVVVERKARAALDAREKQMASMRLRVSDCFLFPKNQIARGSNRRRTHAPPPPPYSPAARQDVRKHRGV